jgi:hypothetical protein
VYRKLRNTEHAHDEGPHEIIDGVDQPNRFPLELHVLDVLPGHAVQRHDAEELSEDQEEGEGFVEA